ncbi:response regulator transcription factor [Clavibacter phaseoli]|uniref:response regulator transcription factor n=1 Tax=Clavibacter phaseoli TaxID=1734031 RepID=UPI000E666E3E|nr:response regulator transcription factor [Clavibacter phaseoli]RIJ56002.1 DNA-binding response regulator [Clavibacter phaseoli]UKF29630.1 response regulator transcription factor [Clavibacter phaseoli]UKF38235.1 response regulator transcription factor [Clavibacter phaseoli]
MITVLVVDDQPLIRQAVSDILEADPRTTVVGTAVDGRAAIQAARDLRPDVVLMDIRMPELDGIGATGGICGDPELAATRVLILTTFEEDEYLVAALRAGASGFIGKGAEPDDIVRAVVSVHAGDALLSPAATRGLITRYVLPGGAGTPSPDLSRRAADLDQLTDREREVLLLVAQGLANQEIGERLFISPHTAKTHVNRVMAKVGAHDRAQLVILAYETGMLRPGEG